MHVVSKDVRFRRVGDELVAVRQSVAEVVVLNDAGARVLELVAEGRSVEGVIDQMLQEFDVGREALAGDVAECLDQLVDLGLITRPAEGV